MKNFIVTILLMLCFGVAKAHTQKNVHPVFTQKKIVVTGINRLKNYNITFYTYSVPVKKWIKKNQIETTVNSFGVEVNNTKIEISSIEKYKNGFARQKLVS